MRIASPRSRQRGMAVMLTALFLAFMIPISGLAIDAGMAMVVRSRLSAAVDSAALAAGRSLNLGNDITTAQAAGRAAAVQFLNANFPPGYMHTDSSKTVTNTSFDIQKDASNNPTGLVVITVTSTVDLPTYFMRLANFTHIPVSASGTATRRSLVMSLILDKSASMGTRKTSGVPSSLPSNATSCDIMVYSSAEFIKNFSPYDYVGMVSFSSTATSEYAPSTNFKNSGSSGLASKIGAIACADATNSTSALYLAYNQVKNVGFKLAKNVVVFFTDGVPNGVPANLPVRRFQDSRLSNSTSAKADDSATATPPYKRPPGNASNCTSTTQSTLGTLLCLDMPVACPTTGATSVKGVLSQAPNSAGDGFALASGPRFGLEKALSTDSTPSWPSGCPTSSDTTMSSQSVAYIPDSDMFGNSTHGPYDYWLYELNYQCADSSVPITSGNDRCKYLGGDWRQNTSKTAGSGTIKCSAGGVTSSTGCNFFPASISITVSGKTYTRSSGTGVRDAGTGVAPIPTDYVGKFRPDFQNAIGMASLNTAVNQANTIRADTNYNIQIHAIFLQGNGGDPVDRDFGPLVVNSDVIPPIIYQASAPTKANPYYNPAQQKGMFLATADANQVLQLFNLIASQLLRLSS